jgi:cytochrome c oxidase cbb3-type subunit 3
MTRHSLIALWLLALMGCDSPASGEVREWTPDDHDQPSSSPAQAPQVSARPGDAELDPSLIDLAWQKNCVSCHGPRGRGDGPQGPMVRAPDLTRAEWQDRVSDQEIAEVIRKGRNKMPAFDLSAPVIDGLVKRIRAVRPKAQDAPPGAPPAAP